MCYEQREPPTLSDEAERSSCVRLLNQALEIAAENRIYELSVNALAGTAILSALQRYELGTKVTVHVPQPGIDPKVALLVDRPEWTNLSRALRRIVMWLLR